jgi:hypothetical protein
MATTWKTIAVRVERPPEASLADFFADMRSWLDHHCIIPAEFRDVTLANKSGVFDVLFDNRKDALHFGRRFAVQRRFATHRFATQLTRDVAARTGSRRSINAAMPSVDQNRVSILAGIASDMRRVVSWTRAKLYQSA